MRISLQDTPDTCGLLLGVLGARLNYALKRGPSEKMNKAKHLSHLASHH